MNCFDMNFYLWNINWLKIVILTCDILNPLRNSFDMATNSCSTTGFLVTIPTLKFLTLFMNCLDMSSNRVNLTCFVFTIVALIIFDLFMNSFDVSFQVWRIHCLEFTVNTLFKPLYTQIWFFYWPVWHIYQQTALYFVLKSHWKKYLLTFFRSGKTTIRWICLPEQSRFLSENNIYFLFVLAFHFWNEHII